MSELRVKVSADGSAFDAGMRRITSKAGVAMASIKGSLAAAFSIGAVTTLAKRTMDYADGIEEMASRIGVSTKALQEWTFAAKQSGTSAEKLVTFIERLSGAAGTLSGQKAFQKIGINADGMTPESLFRSVGKWSQGKSATDIAQAMQGLGIDRRAVGPMINVLQADLDAMGESARKLGAVLDDKTIHALASLNDQLSIVGQVLIGSFAPALLSAGKAAMVAFGKIGGVGAWWGARTSNITNDDMKKVVTPGHIGYGVVGVIKKFIQGAGLENEANMASDAAFSKVEEMLSKIDAYQAPRPSPISIPEEEANNMKKAEKRSTDSLLSVGNFLGAGRGAIENIQRETNRILQTQLEVQRTIARGIENSDQFGAP